MNIIILTLHFLQRKIVTNFYFSTFFQKQQQSKLITSRQSDKRMILAALQAVKTLNICVIFQIITKPLLLTLKMYILSLFYVIPSKFAPLKTTKVLPIAEELSLKMPFEEITKYNFKTYFLAYVHRIMKKFCSILENFILKEEFFEMVFCDIKLEALGISICFPTIILNCDL